MVDFVLNNMQALDKTEGEEQMYSDYEDQFQWFLGFGLFFLCLECLAPLLCLIRLAGQ